MSPLSVVAALTCALAIASGPLPEDASPPNLIVVLVDDWALSDFEASRSDRQRWNDLVHIDGLAAQGLSWSNFYSQTLCNPTRSTLMLGTYRGEMSGGTCNPPNARTPSAETTLAKVLGAAGYTSAAFGKWHIGANPDPDGRWEDVPRAYGFDNWRAWNASNVGGNCGSKDYFDWQRVDDGVVSHSEEYHTLAVASAAERWWRETEGPKFAYVSFQAPHGPLHDPPRALLPKRTPELVTRREKYEAMLVALDTALGTFLEAVDESNTYVFVMGDNGTPFEAVRLSKNKESRAKGTTYEDGVNVPLIVTGPGIAPGETQALGHVVDLMATLAELASAEVPSGGDSVSLAPVLRDPARRVRDHVICSAIHGHTDEDTARETAVILALPSTSAGTETLLKGRWVENPMLSVDFEEFFDLTLDPLEHSALRRDESLDERYREPLARMEQIYRRYRTR